MKITRVGDLVYEVRDRNSSIDDEVLSVSESKGILRQTELFEKQIALEDKSKYKKVIKNDIVYNPYLLWNGAVGTCFLEQGGCTSPAYIILRPTEKRTSRFLHYFFRSSRFTKAVDNIASGSVTRRRTAPIEQILDLSFLLPESDDRIMINRFLESIDSKIDLNRRMNQTLEQLAQAIFKHWFLDNPEREGWEETTLNKVCTFEYGKALKESSRTSGPIPVFGSNGQIGSHNEMLVSGPGIVVGRKGNPGTVTFSWSDFFPIDTTFYVVPKDGSSLFWLFFRLASLNLPNLSADSAVPGLNRNIAYMSKVIIPPQPLQYEFEKLVNPLFAKINITDKESRTLAELRDTLLPKLLSGQVRVNHRRGDS